MIAFTDGRAIIVALPSKSGGGMYLVRVSAEANKLIVEHVCPSHRYNSNCSHIEQAVGYWKILNPWENYPWMPSREVTSVQKHIVLKPTWKQITGKGAGKDVAKYH